MCGIVGIIDEALSAEALSPLVQNMNDAIIHRGPDDNGTFVRDRVALAMRRLSIIDLEGGQQPIWNEDRNVVVIFNGEIYNYRELTAELKGQGHTFRTNSDTEVLVHLYEQHGLRFLQRLRGMFAFAIWDLQKQQLFVARDRLGIKPLYYRFHNQQLVFGSEIKSLLRHPDISATLDLAALNDYLTFKYVPSPRTLFEGIQSLPPGYSLLWRDGKLQLDQYWDLQFDTSDATDRQQGKSLSDDEAVEQLESQLGESVRLRLRSDVPFGAFLSGGLDSSMIVALMSALLEEPVKTFSVGFDSPSFPDELPYAREVAQQYGAEHYEIQVAASDFADLAQNVIWHMDQPIADQATVATYQLSKLARQHVKMVLTGEGGDEIFAGYARYSGNRAARIFAGLPNFAKRALLSSASRVRGQRRAKIALYALCQSDEATRFTNWFPLFNDDFKQTILSGRLQSMFGRGSSNAVFGRLLDETTAHHPLHRMLYVDTKHWLPDFLLLRGDKLTMAHSLEARVPFLDHQLVEFAAGLPPRMKLRGLTRKLLLRKLAKRHLPRSIIDRPKQGFPIPIGDWFRGECRGFLRDLLNRETLLQRGLFHPASVDRLLNEHESRLANHANLLWGLASVELWHQVFIDSDPARFPAAVGENVALASAATGTSDEN